LSEKTLSYQAVGFHDNDDDDYDDDDNDDDDSSVNTDYPARQSQIDTVTEPGRQAATQRAPWLNR